MNLNNFLATLFHRTILVAIATIAVIFTTISQPAFADTSIEVKPKETQIVTPAAKVETTKVDPNQQIDELAKSRLFLEGKACEKSDALWSVIYATRESEDNLVPFQKDQFKSFVVGTTKLFFNSFADTSDIAPSNHARMTHRYGVFAQARLVINPEFRNSYTGLIKGSDCVLVRFSTAPSPAGNIFGPGFVAKFFVDGMQSSQNLIAQHSVAGQGNNMNYYEHPLSNKLKLIENTPSGIAPFSRFFNTIQDYLKDKTNFKMVDPRELSVEHLASIKLNGKAVNNPKSPRFIFLVAPEGRAFSTEMHDFRQDFLALNKGIPADANGRIKKGQGVRLFDVYASENFTDNPKVDAKRIGYLESKSHIVASDTADLRISFRHSITPRETEDYAGEYPKSTFNDKSFTANCAELGASLADMQPNPKDPSGNTSVFFQNYLQRGCGKS
jgi:hypothetical protein